MAHAAPSLSLYIFTGLETKEELCSVLGVEPDSSWTMGEDAQYFPDPDTGDTIYFIGGPHSTGVIYESPLNSDPDADYGARLDALLDRLAPIQGPLAQLRTSHSHHFGQMEILLRYHAVVSPGYNTGVGIEPAQIARIMELSADVVFDFAFTPFERRDGNRYRLRRLDDEQDSSA